KIPIVVVSVAAVAGAVWGGKQYLYSRDHVVTDNAQVDGRLVPIATKLQAFVTRVPVEDNTIVKPGDTLMVLDARDLDADVAKAEADLQSAVAMAGNGRKTGQLAAQLQAAQATASGSQSMVASAEAALKKASQDLDRIKGLSAKQIVPAQQ